MTDAELVTLSVGGDTRAFGALVARYQGSAYGLAPLDADGMTARMHDVLAGCDITGRGLRRRRSGSRARGDACGGPSEAHRRASRSSQPPQALARGSRA